MTLRLLRTSTSRPYAFVRPLHVARTSYYQQTDPVRSKGEKFFIAASYPDDVGSEPVITQYAVGPRSWEANNATASEESIKADRGEIDHPPLTQYAVKPRTWEAMNATASEESIKADRGEIEHPQLTQYAVHPRMWEAINATISEESIKADRGEINTPPLTPAALAELAELQKMRQRERPGSKLYKR